MTSQLTPEHSDVLPKDFENTDANMWLQPWFWLAVLGVAGMIFLTVSM